MVRVARWSEAAGCTGILVYSDNSLVDPWLVSQVIVESTTSLCPLVAVQPVYMHPYSIARMIASIASLHGRRIYLNMVAGGFKNDLTALNDTTPHDRRYHRLIEYTTIIQRLLSGPSPVTFEGEFYRVDKLKLSPPLPPGMSPGVFISGSSEAGMAAARAIGATAIEYPKPAEEYREGPATDGVAHGIRVGIIARAGDEEAWDFARARFPEDRKGQLAHQLAMKVSDSCGTDSCHSRAVTRRRAPTGWCRSRTTRRCARTWWGATSGLERSWDATCPWDIGRSFWTCRGSSTICTMQTKPSIAPSIHA